MLGRCTSVGINFLFARPLAPSGLCEALDFPPDLPGTFQINKSVSRVCTQHKPFFFTGQDKNQAGGLFTHNVQTLSWENMNRQPKPHNHELVIEEQGKIQEAGCNLNTVQQIHWALSFREGETGRNKIIANYSFKHTSWLCIPSAAWLRILFPLSDSLVEQKTFPLTETKRIKSVNYQLCVLSSAISEHPGGLVFHWLLSTVKFKQKIKHPFNRMQTIAFWHHIKPNSIYMQTL